MSKIVTRLKVPRKRLVPKVEHGNRMNTNIPAGMAAAGPPLGPMLGQYNINIASFVKDFNEKTKDIKEGIPIPTKVTVNPDRTYKIVTHSPPTVYFLKQAAGAKKGAFHGGKDVAGKVTLKHIYEIALIKSKDPPLLLYDLKDICQKVIGTARSIGIEVVKDLDPEEYQKFLAERDQYIEDYRKELDEIKESKMLRTA